MAENAPTSEIGLPPEATQNEAPSPKATSNDRFGWLKKFFDKATNVSQADALAGTTAGRVMPEATAAAAAQASKSEQPAPITPSQSTTK